MSLGLNHLQWHRDCWSQRHFYFKWLYMACCRTSPLLLSLVQLHCWQPDTVICVLTSCSSTRALHPKEFCDMGKWDIGGKVQDHGCCCAAGLIKCPQGWGAGAPLAWYHCQAELPGLQGFPGRRWTWSFLLQPCWKSVQQEFGESPEHTGNTLTRRELLRPPAFYLFLCCIIDGSGAFQSFFLPPLHGSPRTLVCVLAYALILSLKSPSLAQEQEAGD